MKEIFILLGSNRGDRAATMAIALGLIGKQAGRIIRQSSIYETEPWGFRDAIPFLNQVAEIESMLGPEALLETLLSIEARLGRSRPFDRCGCVIRVPSAGREETPQTYEGRTIDLDILFYGDRMVFTDQLMVPHPRLHERRFTLVPMVEIAPGFMHPVLRKTIEQLLRDCPDHSTVNLL